MTGICTERSDHATQRHHCARFELRRQKSQHGEDRTILYQSKRSASQTEVSARQGLSQANAHEYPRSCRRGAIGEPAKTWRARDVFVLHDLKGTPIRGRRLTCQNNGEIANQKRECSV